MRQEILAGKWQTQGRYLVCKIERKISQENCRVIMTFLQIYNFVFRENLRFRSAKLAKFYKIIFVLKFSEASCQIQIQILLIIIRIIHCKGQSLGSTCAHSSPQCVASREGPESTYIITLHCHTY